ncbi:hypothetical protein MTO96_016943 [Rhipicephalus appendiculatus]
MKALINADAHVFAGKSSALLDETNPYWAPSLRLRYGFKHEGAARHEHAGNSVTKSGKRWPNGAELSPMRVDEAERGSLSMAVRMK